MKLSSIRLIILLGFFNTSVTDGQNALFLKTYSATPNYNVYSIAYPSIDTLSQNSFITGSFPIRFSNDPSDTLYMDSFILKNEISGLTKWYKNYHLNGYHLVFTDLKVLKNKDILAGGQTNAYFDPDPLMKHGVLLRTDSNGYVKWCRLYPFQKIYRLLSLKNGNIAVLSSDSGSFYGRSLKLALMDTNGNLKWCRKYPPFDANGYNGLDLVEGKNHSVLIVGYNVTPPFESFLILSDSLGNKINDLSMPSSNNFPKLFYNGVNYFDEGFYIVGVGEGNAGNITGSILKIDNSLNVKWYKLLQTLSGNSEFWDISVIGRNNLIIFNEPENYGIMPDTQRSGFTFIDSNGIARKNFLFTTDTFPVLPDEFIPLNNGNMLFTATGYFGITDTLSNGFCDYTTITYPNISGSQSFVFNSFSAVNSSFTYSNTSLYVYAPFDLDVVYSCSSGPSGPLDPVDPGTSTAYKSEEDHDDGILIFPIPANDFLIMSCIKNEKKFCFFNAKINLVSSTGEVVFSKINANLEPYFQLDVRNVNSGIYCINVEFPDGNKISRKIIVTH